MMCWNAQLQVFHIFNINNLISCSDPFHDSVYKLTVIYSDRNETVGLRGRLPIQQASKKCSWALCVAKLEGKTTGLRIVRLESQNCRCSSPELNKKEKLEFLLEARDKVSLYFLRSFVMRTDLWEEEMKSCYTEKEGESNKEMERES